VKTVEDKLITKIWLLRLAQTFMPTKAKNLVLDVANKTFRAPKGITRKRAKIDGVKVDWIYASDADEDKVLLYMHGGSFVIKQLPLHLKFCARLSMLSKYRVLSVDYRLTHYPEELEDCVTAYQWLLADGIKPQNIIFGGDSAGGNLVLAALLKVKDLGLPLPAGAFALSPVVTCEQIQNKPTVVDPLISRVALNRSYKTYLHGQDPKDPLISPLYANFTNFPPILIHVGEKELLLESILDLQIIADKKGWNIHTKIFPKMFHVFQVCHTLPQSDEAVNDIVAFITSL
jgi:acetyl esterase/lipase